MSKIGEQLDLRKCKTYRKEDKDAILSKIENRTDVDHFNEGLRNTLKGIALSWIREENKRLINSLMSENSRLRSENSDLRWQVTALKSTVLENNAFSFS